MPVKTTALGGGRYRVSTPNGVHAKSTTKEKAKKQARLLNAVEHGWKPTGKPSQMMMGNPKVHMMSGEEMA